MQNSVAFTLVELVVVLTILTLLTTLGVASYYGVVAKAREMSLSADLTTASVQIKRYKADNGAFPASIGCPTDTGVGRLCLQAGDGNSFVDYAVDNSTSPQTFQLSAQHVNTVNYRVTNINAPLVCPTGFIVVPGSSTYDTSDFCVMKYEAKNNGSDAPVSVPSGLPWVNITQPNALQASSKVAFCSDCHLISEKEWMTLMQSVLSVPSNWSTGTVGSGYIYSGHNDTVPNNALAASTDDDGYSGTGNNASDATITDNVVGKAQKRTLKLTNGEVVWDMAGNVWEWTSGQTTGGQPGLSTDTTWTWREWTALDTEGTLAVNPNPKTTGLSGSDSWTSANGMGQIVSYTSNMTLRGFVRGGRWGNGLGAGVSAFYIGEVPSDAGADVGFRVAR